MAQQVLKRTAGGLVASANALNEVPEGAMVNAENCVMDRPGVVDKRRGFARYGSSLQAIALFEYQGSLLALGDDEILRYDSTGTGIWAEYEGTLSAPDDEVGVESVEAEKSLYFTSDVGVRYSDALGTTPRAAGMPSGLDLQLATSGVGAGWFSPDTQVGYRLVFGRIDQNERILIGAPTMRETIFNSWNTGLSFAISGGGVVITVTHTSHGYNGMDYVEIKDASPAFPDGTYQIENVTEHTYDFTIASPVGSGGTLTEAKTFDVELDFTVPDDVEDGDFYDVYRTELSASDNTDPGDRQKLVYRKSVAFTVVTLSRTGTTVTVTHTGHGFVEGDVVKVVDPDDDEFEEGKHIIHVTGTDDYTYETTGSGGLTGNAKVVRMRINEVDAYDLNLGEDLYTNVEQEGILQANSRPPMAKHMALFKKRMYYANTTKEHVMELLMLSVDDLVDDTSSLTITQGATALTYTASTAESVSARKFENHGSEPTTAQNIRETVKSLCRIINRDPESLWYAWYTSGIDDRPGLFVIESRTLGTAAFSVTCDDADTTGASFSPTLPESGTEIGSFNQATVNRLYHAKEDQPESVPELNHDPVGDSSRAIIRILALRDSLMIPTESGLYRLSGDSEDTTLISQLDPSIHAVAPRSWVVLDNAIFGLSTGGIVRATETGTQLISFPVDDIFQRVLLHADRDELVHAVAYESDSKYIIWVPDTGDSTSPDVAYVWNTLTRKWAGPWRKAVKAATVLFGDDRLFAAHNDDAYILRERKSLDSEGTDYVDEEIPVTVDSVSTTTDEDGNTLTTAVITGYDYSIIPVAGWSFYKDPESLPGTKVIQVDSASATEHTLTLNGHLPGLTTGSANLGMAINQIVEWAPESAQNAAAMKQFSNVQIYTERRTALHSRLRFYSDIDAEEDNSGLIEIESGSGGFLYREIVPTQHQRCRALSLIFENKYAKENAAILHVAYTIRMTGDRTAGKDTA